ncbi:DUF4398 domain-containing protein [Methylomonas paludis]|uniref:DUF4398 domain-containing protein n=1 Tax=Methylomonas paludis TaxID=1173101 RepID=A0A975RBG7_9GAMM|nr:DUF4398 domain-containing protein [Methylomonas paludis]QWF72393.1 DUF4398 domain-containing protein [Methylomonas paludis]
MNTFYRFRSTQWLQILGVSVSAVLLTAACANNPPPTEQIAVAKAAVNNASAAGATEFAPLPLRYAQDKMEAAEHAMDKEDYHVARLLAEEAEVDALLSTATARSVKAQKAVSQLQQDNTVLRQEIDRKTQ